MPSIDFSVSPLCEDVVDAVGSEFNEYAIIVSWARESGLLEIISQRLKLRRNKGYQGIDLFLFLLAFFAAMPRWKGLHAFADDSGRRGDRLAALGGRQRWPSQAAMSRALAGVEHDQARQFADFLLRESLDLTPILHHDSVQHFDGFDEGWHVFDFDPTATALRQRALPEDETLPPPERLSERIGARGYTGRRRGKVKISRPTLQHRGARLWLGLDVQSGNGNWPDDVRRGFAAVEEVAESQQLTTERCIVCVDGGMGGLPQARRGLASDVHVVTRLATYEHLRKPEVADNLRDIRWERVADSGSGPPRWATEFGTLRLLEGDCRLVVTRFPNTGSKRGTGIVMGEWQYEIFATDLPADAFPASDLVTLYYGRVGQENYFALEDEELNLDHVFSYEQGGQLVACAIGLWFSNVEMLLGWLCHEDKPPRPDGPRPRMTDATEGRRAWEHPPKPDRVDSGESSWHQRFASLEEFEWDEAAERPICPAGHHLRLHGTRDTPSGRLEVRFRALATQCRGCDHRRHCTTSESSRFRKEIAIRVDSAVTLRGLGDSPLEPVAPCDRRWRPPGPPVEAGPYAHRPAVLLPRKLQQRFRSLCFDTHLRVRVDRAPPPQKERCPLFVTDPAHRQRRRKSWQKRMEWNALKRARSVNVDLVTPRALYQILTEPRSPACHGAVR